MWTQHQIEQHVIAAGVLEQIIIDVFTFIREHSKTNEYEIQRYILEQYRQHNLKTFPATPIVAFNASAADPHYFPTSNNAKQLVPNTLIEIDMWAALREPGAPFADITWMAFYGDKVPIKILDVFNIVVEARDSCIDFITQELRKGIMPIGSDCDRDAREVITKAGYGDTFIHSTGHSIGTTSPHGRYGALRRTNGRPLHTNLGYTIEPGIYLTGEFGMRSEINFYIDDSHQLIISTTIQHTLVQI